MEDVAVLGVTFGGAHFGAAQLGDQRRTRRLVELANKIANHPGGTLPDKVNSPASLKALYRLMDCEEVAHRSVLESPRLRTLEKMAAAEGTVLGLAYQHLAKRPKVTKKETRDERRDRADRESRWWKIASLPANFRKADAAPWKWPLRPNIRRARPR